MRELEVEAKLGNLDDVFAFIDAQLEALDCPVKTQMQIDVAIDELFSNVAMYAYAPGSGNVKISFDADNDPHTVIITLTDNGTPYNPLLKEDPDITLSAEERAIGGLGVFMVKKVMDTVAYRFENGCNILTVTKNI